MNFDIESMFEFFLVQLNELGKFSDSKGKISKVSIAINDFGKTKLITFPAI